MSGVRIRRSDCTCLDIERVWSPRGTSTCLPIVAPTNALTHSALVVTDRRAASSPPIVDPLPAARRLPSLSTPSQHGTRPCTAPLAHPHRTLRTRTSRPCARAHTPRPGTWHWLVFDLFSKPSKPISHSQELELKGHQDSECPSMYMCGIHMCGSTHTEACVS
jgi:hypothetical protein